MTRSIVTVMLFVGLGLVGLHWRDDRAVHPTGREPDLMIWLEQANEGYTAPIMGSGGGCDDRSSLQWSTPMPQLPAVLNMAGHGRGGYRCADCADGSRVCGDFDASINPCGWDPAAPRTVDTLPDACDPDALADSLQQIRSQVASPPDTAPFSPTWEGRLIEVTDADTLVVNVAVWPGTTVRAAVRLLDVDAPEIKNATCDAEREKGQDAKTRVSVMYRPNAQLFLRDVKADKWGSRVDAHVFDKNGDSIGAALLDAKIVKPYGNDLAKPNWCSN